MTIAVDPTPIAPAPALEIGHFDLEAFETLVYQRRQEDAVRALQIGLNRLKRGWEFAGHTADDSTRRVLYSRLAAAIAALLCDPLFTLSQEGFEILAVEYATLNAIFRASVFESTDHLLCHFGTRDPADPDKWQFTSPEGVGRLLMLYSLDSRFELDIEQAVRFDPRRALPVFLGMLASHVVLSSAHYERKERLLSFGPLFDSVGMSSRMLLAMADAYMYCSYATSATKHDVKRTFNRMARRLVGDRIHLPAFSGKREIKARPTMLVPIELFTSRHAMFRCYASWISRLRQRFRLVLIGGEMEMDEVSKQLFDEVIPLPPGATAYPELVSKIGSLGPDIIYYPSLGMSPHWVALSSVRLAPIQMMTTGHPATSNSDAIDYTFIPETVPGHPSTLQEITFLVSGYPSVVRRPDARIPEPEIREKPDVLRIAVPSMVAKLSAPFLQVCQNLVRRSGRELEFHFFPGLSGLFHYVATLEIHRWLPGATVHRTADYSLYLSNLGKCDIHMSTFPFGGSNSNVDTMMLCIPMVTLEGLEVHSQSDSGMMRAVGMPEWLIAHDIAEYENAALRLIENDRERFAIAQMLRSLDVEKVFTDRPGNEHSADFADAVWFAYSHHEEIQHSGRRYWSVAQRREFYGGNLSAGHVSHSS